MDIKHGVFFILILGACAHSKSDTACDEMSPTWYADIDGDAFGDPSGFIEHGCEAPAGAADNADDCDDTRSAVHPSALEACDGVDNDCDGAIDEDLETWSPDADGDGYGDASARASCVSGPGLAPSHDDCDDSDASIHPGATDALCDEIDSDCDGVGVGAIAVVDGLEFADAQDAVDAAPEGGTVSFCPGIHEVDLGVGAGRIIAFDSFSGSEMDTVLSGAGEHRMITTGEGASVIIADLAFEDGLARGQAKVGRESCWGGAILSLGADLAISDCSFRRNYSADAGGAIAANYPNDRSHSTLFITRTHFVENEAWDWGGAVFAGSDAVTISECIYSGNTSEYAGGALALASPVVSVVDSVFVDNSAGYEGGAIYGDYAVVSDSTFTENSSGYRGGAIYIGNYDSGLLLERCQFTYNIASDAGGALFGDMFVIVDSVFDGNSAASEGGAIGIHHWISGSMDAYSLALSGSSFLGNSAGDGGAIFAVGRTEHLFMAVQDTTFSGNMADENGVLWASAANVHIEVTGSDFTGNEVMGENGVLSLEYTGSSESESVELLIDTSTFERNHARSNALGSVYGFTTTNVSFHGCDIRGNEAEDLAGWSFAKDYRPLWMAMATIELRFVDTTIEDNVSASSMGVLDVQTLDGPMSLTFENGSLKDNASATYAVQVPNALVLTSTGTDWGEGEDDNTPCDLGLAEPEGEIEFTYCDRDLSSFTCSGDGTCTGP